MTRWKRPNTRGKGELIVIMNNGLVPQREEKAFQTWSADMGKNIRIAVPDYPLPPLYVNPVRLSVDGRQVKMLETVENVDGLARAALSEEMPMITARALARAVVKKKSEKEVGESGGAYSGLAQLAMLLVNTATEIADTRCWNTLPQEIQMARAMLPAGQHRVSLEVIGQLGQVIDRIDFSVTIKARRKTIISKHWTAQRPGRQPGSTTTTIFVPSK
jgi:hypothetical protein